MRFSLGRPRFKWIPVIALGLLVLVGVLGTSGRPDALEPPIGQDVAAKLSDTHLDRMLVMPGDTIRGELQEGDCILEDDSYHDVFILPVYAAHTYQISLESEDFDALLIVLDHTSGQRKQDDDSGEGTDAVVTLAAQKDGLFVIHANSYRKDTGAYTLKVQELTPVT